MPFDTTPQPHAAELAIVDRMTELLATPDRWCKHHSAKRRWHFFGLMQHCLMGAFNTVATGRLRGYADYWNMTEHQANVFLILQQHGGIAFNDREATTHTDILALLAQVRASFL